MIEVNDKAVGLDMPMDKQALPGKMYYGNQYVPHPDNKAACKVEPAKVMRQVLDAE